MKEETAFAMEVLKLIDRRIIMNKKVVCVALVILCIVLCTSCTTSPTQAPTENTADDIILQNAAIYKDYAVLPLCDVITGLGFQLTWDSAEHATFCYNETEYSISIPDKTLTKTGDRSNYLICAPGSEYFVCDVVDGVLMVDDSTVACLFNSFIGYPIQISIDRTENTVTVAKR